MTYNNRFLLGKIIIIICLCIFDLMGYSNNDLGTFIYSYNILYILQTT